MPKLRAFVAEYLGIGEDDLVLEAQRDKYRLYSTTTEEQFIIRIFPSDDEQKVSAKFRSEALIIKYVQVHSDLPVPTIYGRLTDPQQPYDLLVMERMEGIILDEAWPFLDQSQRQDLAAEVAKHLSTLHQINIEGFGALPQQHNDWAALLGSRIKQGLQRLHQHSLTKSLLTRIRVHLAKWLSYLPRSSPVVVHGDINSYNLLVTSIEDQPRISGIIDWEWGMGGVPGYDLTGIESLFDNQYSLVSTFYNHYQIDLQHRNWNYERKLYLLDKFLQNACYYLDTGRYTPQRQRLTSFMIQSLLS